MFETNAYTGYSEPFVEESDVKAERDYYKAWNERDYSKAADIARDQLSIYPEGGKHDFWVLRLKEAFAALEAADWISKQASKDLYYLHIPGYSEIPRIKRK